MFGGLRNLEVYGLGVWGFGGLGSRVQDLGVLLVGFLTRMYRLVALYLPWACVREGRYHTTLNEA